MDYKKRKFLIDLTDTIKQNPEWFSDAMDAITRTVQDEIKESRKRQSDIQYALAMLKSRQYCKLDPASKASVDYAITQCDMFAGTPFAEEAKTRLDKYANQKKG